jgi:hypothetical protein
VLDAQAQLNAPLSSRAWFSETQVYHSQRTWALAMKAFAVAIVVLPLLVHGSARAQDQNDLLGALAELRSIVNALPADISSPALRTATQWLADRPANPLFNAADVSPEYTRSLRRVAALLKGRPSPQVVADVTADLEAKVEHCRKLGIGMGGLVTVRVNTVRAGQPISNLRVQALLKIYEHVNGSEPRAFLRVSSPTQMDLEPGRYWVWALDPSTKTASERVLISVTGQKELVLDLTVP